MKIVIRQSFQKNIKKIRDKILLQKILAIIDCSEKVDFNYIKSTLWLEKLSWSSQCYKIRIWDYRIWCIADEKALEFVTFQHRRDIYNNFPRDFI